MSPLYCFTEAQAGSWIKVNFNYMSTRNERTSVHYLSKENASYSACVNSAGGKVCMRTSIFQSLTRETVLCNNKTC